MSTEQAFDGDNDDSDYTSKSSAVDDSDDDNSTEDTMSDNELVKLYKDQLINVHELLGSSSDDDDDMDCGGEQQVDKKELVGLYKDQLIPIQELAPVSSVEPLCSKNSCSIVRRVPLKPYLIKFAVPVAIALAYIEPISRQSRDENQNHNMNTTAVLTMKALYLVFILCAPVLLMNYRYKLKIDALMHDVIVELQAKREHHVLYPHIYPSAAVSVTQIRSIIVDPTDLSTFEDWQCVAERLDAHPLLGKTMQEERGDFIEYWEMLI